MKSLVESLFDKRLIKKDTISCKLIDILIKIFGDKINFRYTPTRLGREINLDYFEKNKTLDYKLNELIDLCKKTRELRVKPWYKNKKIAGYFIGDDIYYIYVFNSDIYKAVELSDDLENVFNNMKGLHEGIFGDNVKSAIKINGVTIYEPDWKKCETFFEKRRMIYFDGKKYVQLGDMMTEHKVLYCEKDCVICKNTEETDYDEIYVLCPETIYMNHEAVEITYGRNNAFSLNTVSDANDYNIGFVYYGDTKNWGWLEGCHSAATRKTALEELGINRAYLPDTISKKAKDIIKKYTRG